MKTKKDEKNIEIEIGIERWVLEKTYNDAHAENCSEFGSIGCRPLRALVLHHILLEPEVVH